MLATCRHADPVTVEASVAVEIADSSRDPTERLAACTSVFAMGFRNGNIMIEVLAKFYIEGYAARGNDSLR